MLSPKRQKFRKMQKGRMKGNMKENINQKLKKQQGRTVEVQVEYQENAIQNK